MPPKQMNKRQTRIMKRTRGSDEEDTRSPKKIRTIQHISPGQSWHKVLWGKEYTLPDSQSAHSIIQTSTMALGNMRTDPNSLLQRAPNRNIFTDLFCLGSSTQAGCTGNAHANVEDLPSIPEKLSAKPGHSSKPHQSVELAPSPKPGGRKLNQLGVAPTLETLQKYCTTEHHPHLPTALANLIDHCCASKAGREDSEPCPCLGFFKFEWIAKFSCILCPDHDRLLPGTSIWQHINRSHPGSYNKITRFDVHATFLSHIMICHPSIKEQSAVQVKSSLPRELDRAAVKNGPPLIDQKELK
ncbi:hypothetical protein BD779DRAFT_1476018 [Infundibulicybe gibba]|nr:hypothetical protein BD779DRAFT_1476018 [Infundibulicybe gibba]